MLPRPRFRLPLWSAFAIAAGAYVVRSVIHGFEFSPDLPTDAIVLVALLLVIALVAWARADGSDPENDDRAGSQGEDENQDPEC